MKAPFDPAFEVSDSLVVRNRPPSRMKWLVKATDV